MSLDIFLESGNSRQLSLSRSGRANELNILRKNDFSIKKREFLIPAKESNVSEDDLRRKPSDLAISDDGFRHRFEENLPSS